MDLDAPLQIDRCSPSLRNTILAEFHGRIPIVREVKSIPDEEWLKMPGIGQKKLEELHRILGSPTGEQASNKGECQPLSKLEIGTLFCRIAKLESEMHAVVAEICRRTELFHPEGDLCGEANRDVSGRRPAMTAQSLCRSYQTSDSVMLRITVLRELEMRSRQLSACRIEA
ncbi:hypothetical protein [Microvirga lotononidis]|uniref:hypothetical protein n=1 Tax=Microvirga lotononidis TaxID=864069 RepID=UPI00058EAA8A|nr:hypothetical protein [Microvirga lotononidis]WQO26346.1 hypothetical protein U0023_16825 [Microvirga lotononidis]